MKNGIQLIAAERERQVLQEGWTPEHDDQHTDGSLAFAAASYAICAGGDHGAGTVQVSYWPWHPRWWKPSDDPVRNLVKAGALIAAEIDRLQRAAERQGEGG